MGILSRLPCRCGCGRSVDALIDWSSGVVAVSLRGPGSDRWILGLVTDETGAAQIRAYASADCRARVARVVG